MADNKYESINVSENTRKGMSLTSDDVQYISRMLSLQDETWNDAFDENIVQLTKALAEVINEQNQRMIETLDKQTKMIKAIQSDINEIKSDILDIKKRLDQIEDQVDNEEKRLRDVETRLTTKGKRIGVLEGKVELLQPDLVRKFLIDMECVKPTLDKLAKYSSVRNTIIRAIVAIATGVGIALLLVKKLFH